MESVNNNLIDLIYDAITADDSFRLLPHAIALATDSDSAWLLGDLHFDPGASSRPAVTCSYGLDDDVVRGYEHSEYLRDPWLIAGPSLPLGVSVSLARFVDEATFRASAIHNEFLRGRADVLHCMALGVPVEGAVIACSLQRGQRGRAYDSGDEAMLDELRPHLVRMMRARQLRYKNGIVGKSSFDAILIGPDAVFLCDDMAKVIHLNVPANGLLQARSLFHVSPVGRLETFANDIELHTMIRSAVIRRVPTLHVTTYQGKRWMIRVDPAQDASKVAVVIARDVATHVAMQVDTASSRFHLTVAEAKLASSLANGLTIEEHATTRDIKISTARSQMVSLLLKSGCERQAQFIAAVHEMPLARA